MRSLSLHWSLATWDKPASPCRASRIGHGVEVTAIRLARVDRAESTVRAALDAAGIEVTDLRVRDLGESVRVEVPEADVALVAALSDVRHAVAAAGFGDSAFDVRPFRPSREQED